MSIIICSGSFLRRLKLQHLTSSMNFLRSVLFYVKSSDAFNSFCWLYFMWLHSGTTSPASTVLNEIQYFLCTPHICFALNMTLSLRNKPLILYCSNLKSVEFNCWLSCNLLASFLNIAGAKDKAIPYSLCALF